MTQHTGSQYQPIPGPDTDSGTTRLPAWLESVSVAFWEASWPEGEVRYVRGELARELGIASPHDDEPPTAFWEHLLPPADRLAFAELLAQCASSGRASAEFRFPRQDGGCCWLQVQCTKAEATDGSLCIRGLLVDVTDLHHTEEEAQRARSIFVEGPVVFIEWGPGSGSPVKYVTPNIRQFGISPEQCIGKDFVDFIHPDDIRRPSDPPHWVIEAGNEVLVDQADYRILQPDGQIRWVFDRSIAVRDENGQITSAYGYLLDITRRKEIEAELRKSEEFIRRTFDVLPGGIVKVNAQGDITHVNQEAQRMLRMRYNLAANRYEISSRCQLLGEDGAELAPGEHPLCRCLAEGKGLPPVTLGLRYSNERELRWVLVRTTPLFDSSGENIEGAVAALLDVTEDRKAREQLRAHREQLTHVARLNAMGGMVGHLAHEINDPLQAISNFAEAGGLLTSSPLNEASRNQLLGLLEKIRLQALRAGGIVRRVRAFVGRPVTSLDHLDIRQIVLEAINLTEHAALDGGVKVVPELAPGSLTVEADRVQLQQVVINLLQNSYEALKNNGGNRMVQVRTSREGPLVIVEVHDNGPGIPAEDTQRTFETFFTTKSGGLGLGLAICREIVDDLRGTIRHVPSSVGALFRVELPFSADGDDSNQA